MRPVTIRLGAAHLDGMALFDGYDDQDMAEHAAKHPADDPRSAPQVIDRSHEGGFIAVIAGMPVGQITWDVDQDERAFSETEFEQAKGDFNGYYLRVTALTVDEAFRRRGIATALLNHFAAYADRTHGYVNGPGTGWDPGEFTADGAAFWKARTDDDVEVTKRISHDD